jgi:pimeloyl-ACP methyl ester carboxylesterase
LYRLARQGVTLSFEDVGKGAPHMVLIHDVASDHRFFSPQIEHFRRSHRVLAVDLRGHGQSDKPEQEYTVRGYAEDVAWLCYELGIYEPVIVGYGLGGVVGMELASGYPDLAAAVVALDSPILLPNESAASLLRSFAEKLRNSECDREQHELLEYLYPFATINEQAAQFMPEALQVAPSAVASTLENILAWKGPAASGDCRVPVLYIDRGTQATDLERLKRSCTRLTVERTVDADSTNRSLMSEQINQMIDDFLEHNSWLFAGFKEA